LFVFVRKFFFLSAFSLWEKVRMRVLRAEIALGSTLTLPLSQRERA
jgi:hypothetical protein